MEQDSVTVSITAQSTLLDEDVGEMMEEKKGDKDEKEEENPESDDWAVFKADGVEFQINLTERLEKERMEKAAEQDVEEEGDDDDDDVERYFIGELSPFNTFTLLTFKMMCVITKLM